MKLFFESIQGNTNLTSHLSLILLFWLRNREEVTGKNCKNALRVLKRVLQWIVKTSVKKNGFVVNIYLKYNNKSKNLSLYAIFLFAISQK